MDRYNRWINQQIYDCCTLLSDEQRKRDLGAFFRSIHGTLNHLLLADLSGWDASLANPFQSNP